MTDNNKKTHLIVTGRGGGDQVQADWNQTDTEQPDYIKNKPELATVATTGSYNDLTDKPTIPTQVQADWNETDTTDPSYIQNKPTILTQWFGTQAEYDLIDPKDPNTVYHIEGGAPVQSNWNESDNTSLAYIQNKPTIPTVPAMATETLTFTLQGGTVKTVEFYTVPNYFYVEDVSGSDNTLSIVKDGANAPTIEVFKSTDKVNWTSMGQTDTTAITATIPANSKLYLKATTNSWYYNNHNTITVTGNHNIGGNIMSLIYGDNFGGKTTFPAANTSLKRLFYNNYNLKGSDKLELPATTLKNACYCQMFYGCKSLITAPELPATTIGGNAYNSMFQGCTALTAAPVLPATTLARDCYGSMFSGCTSLTTAPELPATNLTNADDCYHGMFKGCTSLITAPALPATTISAGCYNGMFSGCTSLTTAPALPAMNASRWCYNSMFSGCTSLTTAPELPATTIGDNAYNSMFQGCTALTTAPALPATTLIDGCYYGMFNGCTNLNSVTTYAQDISASNCTGNWLNNVTATGDFYNLGGATFPSGVSGIPSGWTEHTSL